MVAGIGVGERIVICKSLLFTSHSLEWQVSNGPEFDTEWMMAVKGAMANESIYHTFRGGSAP